MKPIFAIASLAVLLFAGPTSAVAVPYNTGETGAVCAIGTGPTPVGEQLAAAGEAVVVESCFDTVTDAIEFIEAGAPGDVEQLIGDQSRAVAPAATFILGEVYTGAGYTGSSNVYWGTGSSCSGATFGFPTLAATFNNSIRSASASNKCWATFYDGTSYGGDRLNCAPSCSGMSVMAARTSSIVFRPAGQLG